jgi:hypothetical protein
MRRGALLVVFALAFAASAHAELGRDDQWTYVPANADHGARAELRGDRPHRVPTVLLFQIECLRDERVLVFRYFSGWEEMPLEQMELLVSADQTPYHDDAPFRMPTRRLTASSLEGRLTLNDRIAVTVRDGAYFMISAPNDMGEPWHAGEAPALKRLVRECWERPVG